MKKDQLIVVRGGGDLATGVIQKLYRAGFPTLVLEVPQPTAIRRMVALSEAVYEGSFVVEGMTAVLADDLDHALHLMDQQKIPVLIDPDLKILQQVKPLAVVDAILAKRNLGLKHQLAPITIALGPGFVAGEDCDVVIETMRGHDLGRLIFQGSALPNTGTPGLIAGVGQERVIHAPCGGTLRAVRAIGDTVQRGDILATVDGVPVLATLDGILRGLIRDGLAVRQGLKIADIDPRGSERQNCFTISDKARCLGGAVLEALLLLMRQ